jgi:hypothetical protein
MAERGAKTAFYLPGWAIFGILIVGSANAIVFSAILLFFWRPETVPVPITGDVAIGLHLQLFEAFLAALAIGLAVFGFVGYSALRVAVERRVDHTLKTTMQAYGLQPSTDNSNEGSQTPDLSGLPATASRPKPEDEQL